jgi:Na+-transporting methylmalonyl-CoA/oxaloacetate decarboxylase gamma subunit
MYEGYYPFMVVFSVFVIIAFLVYLSGNRYCRREEGKDDNYACGEKIPYNGIGSENFYPALKGLGFGTLRRSYSGRLSDYILWMVVGMMFVLMGLLIL